jgi:K+-sensing histidine kinase KdpD
MKTPDKVKASIWRIAEENGLSDIVIGYGVDRVWELMHDEVTDDIFTPLSEICLDVLNELAACDITTCATNDLN